MNRSRCKQRLINNLQNDIYCRVGVSKVVPNQVGVIATRDIPAGTNPFATAHPRQSDRIIELTHQDLEGLDPTTRQMVNDFYVADDTTGTYPVNQSGLNGLDVSFYLNHSDQPNLNVVHDNSGDDYAGFRTNRNIKKGEELTYRYSHATF